MINEQTDGWTGAKHNVPNYCHGGRGVIKILSAFRGKEDMEWKQNARPKHVTFDCELELQST